MTAGVKGPDHATIQSSQPAGKYGDADGYDSYMGRWSAALAPLFLRFAAVGHPASLLDIGSGTGNLPAAAKAAFPDTRIVGIDPSAALLQRARARPELARVEFMEGGADRLPFESGTFDCCLSLLVLQEFTNPLGAVQEMRRVTRSGGIVAACQWDFSRMPVIAALIDAIAAVDPESGVRLAAGSPRPLGGEVALAHCWTEAGFNDVTAARIEVVQHFGDFDELWLPLLSGSTPSTITLASLPSAQRAMVRDAMRKSIGKDAGGFSLRSQALVVKGEA